MCCCWACLTGGVIACSERSKPVGPPGSSAKEAAPAGWLRCAPLSPLTPQLSVWTRWVGAQCFCAAWASASRACVEPRQPSCGWAVVQALGRGALAPALRVCGRPGPKADCRTVSPRPHEGVPCLARQPDFGVCALQQRSRPRVSAAAREPAAAAGHHGPRERHLPAGGGELHHGRPAVTVPVPVPDLLPARVSLSGPAALVWLPVYRVESRLARDQV